jgi:hypothetical protein
LTRFAAYDKFSLTMDIEGRPKTVSQLFQVTCVDVSSEFFPSTGDHHYTKSFLRIHRHIKGG